ncbi:tRNA 4-thiouridine(8) synthase ThiI [bacterium]|nr:tRNA 4-thiouridine(8) synthase ThiI [bacterium]
MTQKKAQIRALVLFSGGLDSRLTAQLLKSQNIDVETVYFSLPFNQNPSPTSSNHLIECTKGPLFHEYMNLIQNPQHGRGSGMNPCPDCRIFLLKKTEQLRKSIQADFLSTGEVLGQRPFSQKKHQLFLVEREAGVKGKVLRPLSAKLLPKTQMEKQGLIDRNRLLGIRGAKRNKQIHLAEKYSVDYPNPTGGCLLCDRYFAQKLKDLFNHYSLISPAHIKLLKLGRHFRNHGKIVLGRNKTENDQLETLNKSLNFFVIPQTSCEPTSLYEHPKDEPLTRRLIQAYSTKNLKYRKQMETFRIEFQKDLS